MLASLAAHVDVERSLARFADVVPELPCTCTSGCLHNVASSHRERGRQSKHVAAPPPRLAASGSTAGQDHHRASGTQTRPVAGRASTASPTADDGCSLSPAGRPGARRQLHWASGGSSDAVCLPLGRWRQGRTWRERSCRGGGGDFLACRLFCVLQDADGLMTVAGFGSLLSGESSTTSWFSRERQLIIMCASKIGRMTGGSRPTPRVTLRLQSGAQDSHFQTSSTSGQAG